jgi:CHAT domain-containing protein/Tfp pilus assembly protein PilF
MKCALLLGSLFLVLQVSPSLCAQHSSFANNIQGDLKEGLVVAEVTRNAEADQIGLRIGDILIGWRQGARHGNFKSPFDISELFLDQAPRDPIIVRGWRKQRRQNWVFHSDTWGFSVRPNLSGRLLSAYIQGQNLMGDGRVVEAIDYFRTAAFEHRNNRDEWLSAWFLSHAAKALLCAGEWGLSDALYAEALLQAGAEPDLQMELLRQRALGRAQSGDLEGAEKYYQRLLADLQNVQRRELTQAHVLRALGLLELQHGDYSSAEQHFTHALTIGQAIVPNSIQTILALANLAVVYQDKGDFRRAENLYFKALEKEEKYFPHTSHLVGTLSDFGILLDQEGDFGRAEAYHRRALKIAVQLDPESLNVADILANLANCILEQGNARSARYYQRRALSIRSKVAPESLPVANSLAGLGKIAGVSGDLVQAEQYYGQALAMSDKLKANSRELAGFLMGLGAILRREKCFSKAETLYRDALALIERDDPTSVDRGTILAELAGTIYGEGRPTDALHLYREAFDIFEHRAVRLGNIQEIHSRFRAEHSQYYQEYISLLIKQGHATAAFEAFEGARARSLYEMLVQARVDGDHGGDPALRQRARDLHRFLAAKADYRIRLRSQPHTATELAALDKAIDDLLLAYQEVQAQLRANADYSEFPQSQALHALDIQNLLDPNTLLLEYSLGNHESYVWVVTHKSLEVYPLPGRISIEAAAQRLRQLITLRRHNSSGAREGQVASNDKMCADAAQALSQIVLGPVAPLIGKNRLVIVSDGSLQYIPFSVLPIPSPGHNSAPLIVTNEIVNLPSASVLAQLRQQASGRKRPPLSVAVLADPVFDVGDERVQQDHQIRHSSRMNHLSGDLSRSIADVSPTRGGPNHLGRLLYSRNEAEAVIAVTPPGIGMLAVDFAANRKLATSSELAKYRIVHFATHGILDNKHPELSGLVLSLVAPDGRQQSGFLNLQDIYDMNLPVELVVLSGCETGLGEQINGEGLIGLTRGFMNAGATRVIASFWQISDTATSILMADFYRLMQRDGLRPAAALRIAQIRMWKQKQWSAPYYWAAFQLQGEWR